MAPQCSRFPLLEEAACVVGVGAIPFARREARHASFAMTSDEAEIMQCRTEFADDGSLNTLMFVPEEMKAEAAEHGVVVREDGYAVIESTTWKEENGKFYYDTKTEGEVFGEKVDPFAEIPVTTDGCLVYSYGTILLERA